MITIDHLLNIAVNAESKRKNPANDLGRGADYTLDCLQRDAMTAAQWLEEKGLTEIKQIGNFGGKDLKRGDKVRIKKGTRILSMHPRYTRENPKIARRDYVVTVYDTYQGFVQSHWHSHKIDQAVRNQQVVWPGEGGYWCMVDTSEVEVVEA